MSMTAQSKVSTRKRGRPSADEAAAIGEQILQAATACFLRDGYAATSMEAVAEAACVPKSTLYKRFPDKMSLLREVIATRVATWSDISSRENWRLTDDLRQRLKFYARGVVTWGISDEVRAFTRLAAGALNVTAEVADVVHSLGYAHIVELIEHDIGAFGPDADIVAHDPKLVASAIVAMLCGWVWTRRPEDQVSEKEAHAFADQSIDLVWDGRAAW